MQPAPSPSHLPKIGFAGMTHLGIVSASVIASRGFETICFDDSEALVENLRAGALPVVEPDLDDLVGAHADRLRFTTSLGALTACDVVYIALDVPTDDKGRSDLSPIVSIIRRVAAVLGPTAVLVVLCQVPPGFTRQCAALPPARLFYQVETLVFGRAVERARHPERYIIGCADPAQPIDTRLLAVLNAAGCPVLPMRYESAEFAKIAINCCLVSSISVANTLSELCEQTGADWSEIAPALKLDARIGPQAYLTPGLGIAGGNLERDLTTVIELAERHGTDADVVRAWITNSRHRRNWAAQTLQAALPDMADARVAVWGLAYKENTRSIKNSPSLATMAALPGVSFVVHDPTVRVEDLPTPRPRQVSSPIDALADADALLVLTPWPVYRDIPPETIARAMRGRIVIDPYRVLKMSQATHLDLDYRTLGTAGSAQRQDG